MVVIRTPYAWWPTLEGAAARLSVDKGEMGAFARALDEAVHVFAPFLLVREMTIDAVGDGFVMLSGEWLEDARLAERISEAHRAWAFVASAGGDRVKAPWGSALATLAVYDALAERVDAMRKAERTHVDAAATTEPHALLRILDYDGDPEPGAAIGVLYATPKAPHKCGGNSGCTNCLHDCTACNARSTNA